MAEMYEAAYDQDGIAASVFVHEYQEDAFLVQLDVDHGGDRVLLAFDPEGARVLSGLLARAADMAAANLREFNGG